MVMVAIGLFCLVLLSAGAGLMMAWPRLGASVSGERLDRLKQSANYQGGKFQNPIPTDNSYGMKKLWETLKLYLGDQKRVPDKPLPIVNLTRNSFAAPPTSGLRITWLGHSSVLMEIDGLVVLLDPVFSDRASPLTFIGPKRFHPVPVAIADLPDIDAVVISHDHYDHLDYDSILELQPRTEAFYLPLGVGAHLEDWGVPAEKIIEMDWWEEKQVKGNIRLIACPARHFSGRMGMGDRTQWASWAVIGPLNRVFYSGDTGIMPLFEEVGQRFGPFDATLIKIGAYSLTWHDIHLNPEEGLQVHQMVKGRLMIPVHWGAFSLSYHSWKEPVERLVIAAEKSGSNVTIPRPGQAVEPRNPPTLEHWWSDIDP